MIHASTQQARPKPSWKDYIFTKEDYDTFVATGLAWVWFSGLPDEKEFSEYLINKEKQVVAD